MPIVSLFRDWRWYPKGATASVLPMRARYLLLIAALFSSVLVAPAYALPSTVKSIDAPWVYFYADSSTAKQIAKEPIPRKDGTAFRKIRPKLRSRCREQ